MSEDKGQQPLDLELPKKIAKKNKGYYLPEEIIDFVKEEAKRLGASENDVLVAIVRCYQKNALTPNLDGDDGAPYTTNKE